MTPSALFLGIDVGTGGCRAIVIDGHQKTVAHAEAAIAPALRNNAEASQDANIWWEALLGCIQALGTQCDTDHITRLAIDGTSATVLLCDSSGQPLAPALMYNDARATEELTLVANAAGTDSAAVSASSSLAKVLWLLGNTPIAAVAHIQHQADWLSCKLTGVFGHSDYHNVLKLGFDPKNDIFPSWIDGLGIKRKWLPQVHAPGDFIGHIQPALAKRLGLNPQIGIVAGTTDSIAAFIAGGAHKMGDAVTSLGSTLVLKQLSDKPVSSARFGVYSHRLGKLWLVGGASNSGGAVLRKYFTDEEMTSLSQQLQPGTPTGLNYYPLLRPGERFPVNDPALPPRIEPIPDNTSVFFQALLEGIAQIEQQGYKVLQELGAPPLNRVFTAGGGSHNKAWAEIRQAMLGVPVLTSKFNEAAYGSALLAAGQTGYLLADP